MSILVRNVSKRFGDFVALEDVSLDVRVGCAHRPPRPERLRKVDPAPHHRRPRDGRRRRDPPRRQGRDRARTAEAKRRLRVPALRRVQAHDRPRQRRVRPEGAQAAEGRDRRPRRRAPEPRPAAELRPPLSSSAVGRPAAAHGPRPRPRARAAGAPARRAVRRPRRSRSRGAARVAAPAARRRPRDHGLRHPRPGRGDGDLRPDRRDQPRQARAGRQPARALRRARRASS